MTNFSKQKSEKVLRKVATIAKKSVAAPNQWGWPPDCIGIFYQSKRPKSLRKDNKTLQ